MNLQLQDIIDLDYLMDLDEHTMIQGKSRELTVRDREIFMNIPQELPDDKTVILSWLHQRRQMVQKERENIFLPGCSIASLLRQAGRFLLITGLLSGCLTVYSFLAYHGVRPVNVTLFFTLFVALPLVLCLVTMGGLAVYLLRHDKQSLGHVTAQSPLFRLVLHTLSWIAGKASLKPLSSEPLSSKNFAPQTIQQALEFFQNKNFQYQQLFFWPIVGMMSGFALGFSLGGLFATLFRVITSDMAFGWQSTLTTSPAHIQELVSVISLPWSWAMPQALPDMAQIQGSRIFLKQGIAALHTQHLTAWWPFLCMSMTTYTVLPRLILMVMTRMGFSRTLANHNFHGPKFRKLLIRMQSPVMDTDVKFDSPEIPCPPPLSLTRTQEESKPLSPPNLPESSDSSENASNASSLNFLPAVLLVPKDIFEQDILDYWAQQIHQKLHFSIEQTIFLPMDFEQDHTMLSSLIPKTDHEILILQEIWQPPIRGLLYYYTQLADKVFPEKNLWIVLVPDKNLQHQPGHADHTDQDAQIWHRAVERLAHPALTIEKME